ncbi:MFS transporter [Mesosutterella sp. OilRF-GAM-744-9]|uniref:MFS transporter n=1 Tax=Mesosutterella porci TaxID=2915351 RepID=A0ABS9MPP6_9BURK|nr:MFS transporter [Mesosutterella sp. oilRF-744-WT-GAM-9]MCG5030588.1 MFS transporter [Mesosutterella sp. oilRF-744-WT-GAM-9]
METEILTARRRRGLYLAAFCLINFCTGALYVWSVFSAALAERFTAISGSLATTSQLGSIFGLATGITPFLMLAGGIVNDRMGPRAVIGAGGLCIGAGYLLSALASTPSELYLAYGLLVGAGTGLVNGCTINTSVKFFPDRRGFAGGAVTASLGIGAAVLSPLASGLISAFGVACALAAFGIASSLVIVAAALITRKCPDGFAESFPAASGAAARRRAPARNLNWLGMLKSPTFPPLAALFIVSTTMGLMLLSNIASIARAQVALPAAAAALAVSVISIANTSGRFISGVVSDRLGRVPTLMIALLAALAGFAMLCAAGAGDSLLFFAGIIAIGLCFGAFVGIYPGLVADEYGPRHNSVNFSVMAFGYSVGSIAGPALLRWADTGEGDFTRAYGVCSAAALAGLAFAVIYLLLERRVSK